MTVSTFTTVAVLAGAAALAAAAVVAPAFFQAAVLLAAPVALIVLASRAGDAGQLNADTLRISFGIPEPLR